MQTINNTLATLRATLGVAPAPQAPVAPVAPAPAPSGTVSARTAHNWQRGAVNGAALMPKHFILNGINPSTVITLLVANNPKTRKAGLRFSYYKTGQTVAQYSAAILAAGLNTQKGIYQDLAWDFNHGFIGLNQMAAPVATPATNTAQVA